MPQPIASTSRSQTSARSAPCAATDNPRAPCGPCHTGWTSPPASPPGHNTIELDVTNLWPNRLIGDAQPSAKHTYTRTNIRKYKADSPLLPSGLIGPAALEIDHETTVTLPRSGIEESVRRDR